MIWNTAAQNLLNLRAGYATRCLIWIEAKEFSDNSPATFGLWTDGSDQTINVEGENRLYYGHQGAINLDPFTYNVGTNIQTYSAKVSAFVEAEAILRGYNTRLAISQVHIAVLDPRTYEILDIQMAFDGQFDGAPIITPDVPGVAVANLKMISSARFGTLLRNGKKSQETQSLRSNDNFRQYGAIAGKVPVAWGSKA